MFWLEEASISRLTSQTIAIGAGVIFLPLILVVLYVFVREQIIRWEKKKGAKNALMFEFLKGATEPDTGRGREEGFKKGEPIFGYFSDEKLNKLAEMAVEKTEYFEPGKTIVNKDAPATTFYIVTENSVEKGKETIDKGSAVSGAKKFEGIPLSGMQWKMCDANDVKGAKELNCKPLAEWFQQKLKQEVDAKGTYQVKADKDKTEYTFDEETVKETFKIKGLVRSYHYIKTEIQVLEGVQFFKPVLTDGDRLKEEETIVAGPKGATLLALDVEELCKLSIQPRMSEDFMAQEMKKAMTMAKISRIRISGGAFAIGWVFVTVAIGAPQVGAAAGATWARGETRLPAWLGASSSWYYALLIPGLCFWLLALQPVDKFLIRLTSFFFVLLYGIPGVLIAALGIPYVSQYPLVFGDWFIILAVSVSALFIITERPHADLAAQLRLVAAR